MSKITNNDRMRNALGAATIAIGLVSFVAAMCYFFGGNQILGWLFIVIMIFSVSIFAYMLE